jgi:ribosomal protein S18 acetylase RimI-like enzyme
MSWTIRVATLADASALPRVEHSAGRRFLEIPELAWLADGEDMPVEAHQRYIAQGTEWVALDENQDLVGFLAAEIVNRDLHIWEVAVRGDVQHRGIGHQLIDAATVFARERRLESLTLTTFTHVPWNAPWYSRLGFKMSSGDERLLALVRTETERGWPRRCAMRKTIDDIMSPNSIVLSVGEAPEIEAFLADRIYEFNAKVTGYFDGESFSGTQRDELGVIRAGVCGYTWGGCCYISYLWVDESQRRCGLGTALLNTAEKHAKTKGCKVVLVATHTFQAPGFYERKGYKQQAVVQNHPVGHESVVFAKLLHEKGKLA